MRVLNRGGGTMGYRIDWSGGPWETTDSYDEAVGIIRREYPDAAIGHAGDLEHGGDRTLAWRGPEDAGKKGDGARFVATIRAIH